MIRIDELPIPDLYKHRLKKLGINTLYPPQEAAVKLGLFNNKSFVLATPTASGKTLVAMLSAIKHISERRGKVIYLVPLKALANEKYNEFTKVMSDHAKVIITTGDYDDPGERLRFADIIIATYEKMDSLLRHKPSWLWDISLIIVDEIHYIDSIDRGSTLEVLITKLLYELSNKQIQLLALSATISNTKDFEKWLNTKVVSTDWRPVPLKEGVYIDGYIIFSDEAIEKISDNYGNPVIDLALDTIKRDEQAIIFVQRRRDAVLLAKKIAEKIIGEVGQLLYQVSPENEKLSREILSAGEVTELSRILSRLVRYKVGFHHAGLPAEHRKIIEDAFKKGYVKILTATPTLAAGVNLPAKRVIITTLYRYELGYREPISVFEYKQMAGRAGRPQFDEYGEAIVVARSEDDAEYIMDYYINGRIENIRSKLVENEFFDMHLLGLLAYRDGLSLEDLERFFRKTLCSVQYGISRIKRKISDSLQILLENNFVTIKEGRIFITKFGRRIAELYILPSTAITLKQFIEENITTSLNILMLLYSIVSTPDSALAPYYSREEKKIEMSVMQLLSENPELDIDFVNILNKHIFTKHDILQRWKTVLVLYDWINEISEDEILNKWLVEPGDLQIIRSTAEWISYAASQISLLLGHSQLYTQYYQLSLRLKHGVRKELLPLVMIEDIGRVRARALYQHGYKTPRDLKKATYEELLKVPGIGEKLARKLLGQA